MDARSLAQSPWSGSARCSWAVPCLSTSRSKNVRSPRRSTWDECRYEALRDLAVGGIVTVEAGRGTFLVSLAAADITELPEVRLAIDGIGARLAAQKGTSATFRKSSLHFGHSAVGHCPASAPPRPRRWATAFIERSCKVRPTQRSSACMPACGSACASRFGSCTPRGRPHTRDDCGTCRDPPRLFSPGLATPLSMHCETPVARPRGDHLEPCSACHEAEANYRPGDRISGRAPACPPATAIALRRRASHLD